MLRVYYMRWCALLIILIGMPMAVALNNYTADISLLTSQTVYTQGARIELKGSVYLSNYSDNGSIITNRTAVIGVLVNLSIITKDTNITRSSYLLNTSAQGRFSSRSDFDTSATLVTAPSITGDYHLKATYTDPNTTVWYTKVEIRVINESVDMLEVGGDKVVYEISEAMLITVEAIRKVGDQLSYVSNVTVNGSLRNSTKGVVSNFSCQTGSTGKCTVSTTAPTSYGKYIMEINNFKAFTSFEVRPFKVLVAMKDELGQTFKHLFSTGNQASVEVVALTNSSTETYTFVGIIRNGAGGVASIINSTTLNNSNSYLNRYTFTLDSLSYPVGNYLVEINITKTGGGTIQAFTSFEVRSWSLDFKKRELGSGFEYEYTAFPGKLIYLEIYPTWRVNGSIISTINTTSSLNISLTDGLHNIFLTTNATWNATCGTAGCYDFNITTPSTKGTYFLSILTSYESDVQTARRQIKVSDITLTAQSIDKEGVLKDLFGANDYLYVAITGKNTTSTVNLTNASVISIEYMNGTEYSYTQVSRFDDVNTTNTILEWAFNSSLQQFKIDTPSAGGIYNVYLAGENNTAATFTRFIVNPYDVCLVAKNTPGSAGGTTGYYYAYQFKTTDTIYFEIKVTRASNPSGRAASANLTAANTSYGMGAACSIDTQSKQVVTNATISIEEVLSMRTGKSFNLNATESSCQSDDNSGGYTCTITPQGKWDSGSYGVRFKIIGQDKQTTDVAFGGFDAKAFYLYAYPTNWRTKPTDGVALNIYMYEAGNNWWGNFGAGGLSGTVSVERVEYRGTEGEWLWPPIVYSEFNVSKLNTTTITNGEGSFTLPAVYISTGQWKPGSYRALLKGVDNGGNTDYGYAWFEIKRWEVYAAPVDCSTGGSGCQSVYNINSKKNISLYVTIGNAGSLGTSGQALGGPVSIRVKKIQDCRQWPCTDFNSSTYTANTINVTLSAGWYWSGTLNHSYLINISPTSGSWGTGYYQVILDVNGSETGRGWYNTIAFYAQAQPTDVGGVNWRYSIKNTEPMYFAVTTTQSQRGGYYYGSYASTDYINTTIKSSTLRRWEWTSGQQVQYTYPGDFNISILQGGTTINGSRVINLTTTNKTWVSGYYYGELVLKNNDNETSTAWLWFQVIPFRVQITSDKFTIDSDQCINGTINIYDPDWRTSTVLNGTYNITVVSERIWSGNANSITTFTSYSPNVTFNGTSAFHVCPSGGTWGSGSWGNYHYLDFRVQDSARSAESGWLSFRTVPFSIRWGSIVGGTSVRKTSNIQVPANLTYASSGANTSGNLTKLYQWRWDQSRSRYEEYNFSVGSCDKRTVGTKSCRVNGTQTVTIYPPGDGWREAYNYIQAQWTQHDSAAIGIQDYSGIWFNGVEVYTGWWNTVDNNSNWKWRYSLGENITIKLFVRDTANVGARVNITKVEFSDASKGCWSDYCRTYNNATYSIVGQTSNEINDSGIIRIHKGSTNWTKGYMYIQATVSGVNGTTTIKNGNVWITDLSAPTVNVSAPRINATINGTSFTASWTTSENANCQLTLRDYDTFYTGGTCTGWNTTNATNAYLVDSCNQTKYSFVGSSDYYEYVTKDYHAWSVGSTWGTNWDGSSSGIVTGGTTHSKTFTASFVGLSSYTAQDYGLIIHCDDEDWNRGASYTAFAINHTPGSGVSRQVNVTLLFPANNSIKTTFSAYFNYSFNGPTLAKCQLFNNISGYFVDNITSTNLPVGTHNFTDTLPRNTTLRWNIRCEDSTNSSNYGWGDNTSGTAHNRTVFFNITSSGAAT